MNSRPPRSRTAARPAAIRSIASAIEGPKMLASSLRRKSSAERHRCVFGRGRRDGEGVQPELVTDGSGSGVRHGTRRGPAAARGRAGRSSACGRPSPRAGDARAGTRTARGTACRASDGTLISSTPRGQHPAELGRAPPGVPRCSSTETQSDDVQRAVGQRRAGPRQAALDRRRPAGVARGRAQSATSTSSGRVDLGEHGAGEARVVAAAEVADALAAQAAAWRRTAGR